MMLYKVTSVAFDPDARTAYYTEDNYAFRDLFAVNVDTGQTPMLLKDARIGDMVVNPADKIDLGYPPRKRPCDDRPDSSALRRLQPDPHVQIRPGPVRPGHLARRQIAVRLVRRDQRHADDARVEARRNVAGRGAGRGRTARASALHARRFRLRAGRQDDVRHVLLYRRLEHLPLRHRHAEVRRGQQRLDRILPSDPAAGRFAHRLRI